MKIYKITKSKLHIADEICSDAVNRQEQVWNMDINFGGRIANIKTFVSQSFYTASGKGATTSKKS